MALSFAAAATKKLKLGTGICLIPQHDPIVTAKSVASLDQLSGGRFIFAMGGGWNVEEMENHGARYETRFKLLRERVLAMKELWTKEEAGSTASSSTSTGLVLPQAQAAAASAALPRRRDRPHPEARGGVLRRLVPPRRAAASTPGRSSGCAKAAETAGAIPCALDHRVRRAPMRPRCWRPIARPASTSVLLGVPDSSRDEILRCLDKNAPLAKGGGVNVAIGLGLMEYPFAGARGSGAGSTSASRAAPIRCGRPTASSAARRSLNAWPCWRRWPAGRADCDSA